MIKGYVEKKLVMRQIRNLGGKAGRRVLRKATTASGTPVAKRLRQLIPRRTAHGWGTLKKSITKRTVSNFAKGQVQAEVGAKRKQPGKPSRYFHLVDKGAKAHRIGVRVNRTTGGIRAALAFWDGSRIRNVASVQHPGLIGKQYVWRARRQTRNAATKAFVDKARVELAKEIAKAKNG